jgi:hypothetical protein
MKEEKFLIGGKRFFYGGKFFYMGNLEEGKILKI